jgi:nucleoside-diphosphate-sugar epimerase
VKILLTGASSFTGYWFARELAAAGHHVVAPLRGAEGSYSAVRAARVRELAAYADVRWSFTFGDARFLDLAAAGRFDLLCHHAARVSDYRSPDFDVVSALAENTRGLPEILRTMQEKGLQGMVLTGSVFEANEGAGDAPMRAFSPYGVSKGITAAVVRYWCSTLGVPLGKFVIPNPFGPLEEPRFCAYLIKTWSTGKAAEVRTPLYVRDNVHVGLLAKSYASFAPRVVGGPAFQRINPSGYVESQEAFARRFAAEVGPRLGLDAELLPLGQTDFSEPMVRINTEPIHDSTWSETRAWDDIAAYHRRHL